MSGAESDVANVNTDPATKQNQTASSSISPHNELAELISQNDLNKL